MRITWGWILAVIFLLAFALRLFPMQEYHGWDETAYLQHAERFAFGKSNYDELAFRPPLLSVILAGGFFVWHSPYIASILVALLSACMCLGIFLIGKRLHSVDAGLYGALIAAVHPFFVQYGRLVLTDTLVAALLALALGFMLDNRLQGAALAGACAGLAGLMKFTGLGAVPVLVAYLVYVDWTHKPRFFRGEKIAAFAAALALVLSPYVIWATMKYDSIMKVLGQAQAIVNAVSGGPLTYLDITLLTIPLLVGIGLFILSEKKKNKALLPFALLSIGWLTIIIGYLLTFPNKELRFATAAIVPLFGLAGIGYAKAASRWRYAAIVAVVFIVALSATSFERWSEPPVNHWKSPAVEISHHISELGNSTKPIYTTSEYPVYGYYTNNKIVVVDGPQFARAYPLIMPRDGYLIVYTRSTREPTVAWADQQRELKRIAQNDEIVLYSYTKRN